MDIKDLAGISEPIKKLIEVVSNGMGALANPFLIRKTADAKAYEIRSLASAVADGQKLIGKIQYDNNGLVLTSGEETIGRNEIDSALIISDRTTSRLNYQQLRKQINLEQIISLAADDLRNETSVSEESLDDDWVSRFFNLAEDVNSEEMKILWAKILAGEVKKPNSYSLRTLELLKNISKKEAELFARVSQFTITLGPTAFIPVETVEEFGISFLNLLLLEELDLIMGTGGTLSISLSSSPIVFTIGGLCLILNRNDPTIKQVSAMPLTSLGKELLSLVEVSPDFNYLKNFATKILKEGEVLKYGKILKVYDNGIEHADLVDL